MGTGELDVLPADLVVRSVGLLRHPAAGAAGRRALGHGAARGRPGAARRDAGARRVRGGLDQARAQRRRRHQQARRPGDRRRRCWPTPPRARCAVAGRSTTWSTQLVARGAEPVLIDDWRAIDAAEVGARGRRRGGPARRCTSARRCSPPCAGGRRGAGADRHAGRSGRLAAVTGPSSTSAQVSPVSFARGAPSTDIVDVAGLRAGGDRRLRHRSGRARPATARRSATCRCGSGSPRSTASPEDHVLVTNGSMQADAFLFDELVRSGDAVVTERPDLRPHPARPPGAGRRPAPGHPAGGRDRRRGDRRPARERRAADARAHHPELPEPAPATRCRWPSAERLRRAGPRARVRDLRGRPYVDVRFTGEPLPRMLELDGGADSGHVVYASSFSKTVCPRHPRRLPGRAAGDHRPHPPAGHQHLHRAEHGRPGRS